MNNEKPSRPKFANPPVQEVGISFRFDPDIFDPDIFDSNFQTNNLEKYVENFTKQNQSSLRLIKSQFQLIPDSEQNITETNNPIKVKQKFASATFEDQSHRNLITISSKAFSFRLLRQPGYIPQYELALPEAKREFSSFLGNYNQISELELYYHDEVELPLIDNQVHTSDYFNININLPDNMEFIRSDIDLKLSLVIPDEQLPNSSLILEVKHVKSADKTGMCFDFNWFLQSRVKNKSEESVTEESITKQLDTMHNLMYSFFNSTFTKKCKELFNQYNQ